MNNIVCCTADGNKNVNEINARVANEVKKFQQIERTR